MRVEIERVVAHGDDHVMPYLWVRESERDELEAALADDPTIEHVELLADLPDEWLYEMKWISQIETLVQILVEEDGTILEAVGSERSWNFRLLLPDRDALSHTYDYCENHEFAVNILRVYELDEGRQGRFGLTEEQHDTLILAAKRGYYEVPRTTTAHELADQLEVSHQAVSERLRRGHGSVVTNALLIGRGAGKQVDRGQ